MTWSGRVMTIYDKSQLGYIAPGRFCYFLLNRKGW